MKTCKDCDYFQAEDFSEEFAKQYDVDGYCEYIEAGVKRNELCCNRL